MNYIIVCITGGGVEWAEKCSNIHQASYRVLELLYTDDCLATKIGGQEYAASYFMYGTDCHYGRAFSINGLCNYGGTVYKIEPYLKEWGHTKETILEQINKDFT